MRGFRLREATVDDRSAIEDVTGMSPDGGAVSFTHERHIPASATDLDPLERFIEVVAEDATSGQVVGTARLHLGDCFVDGEVTRYALLNGLAVHPAYRRRGLATALARWRVRHATDLVGPDVAILANIQSGNAASLRVAQTWAGQVGGRMTVTPIPMRRRPPRPRHDLIVDPAADAHLEQIADALNSPRRTFARVHDPDRLRSWLAVSPFNDPVNHYLIVRDQRGQLLAGMGLREEGRLLTLVVEHAPWPVRLANVLVRVIPPDGRLRNLVADKIWYAPGRLDAARHLWQTVRWDWRERGSTLLSTHDPRGPVHQVVNPAPWQPATSATVAVRWSRKVDFDKVLEPLL